MSNCEISNSLFLVTVCGGIWALDRDVYGMWGYVGLVETWIVMYTVCGGIWALDSDVYGMWGYMGLG